MAIQIECPSCFEILSVPDPAAGGMFRCGVCQTVIRVPGEQPTDDIPAAELLPNESHPSDRRAAERAGRDERKDPPRRRTRRAAARRTGRGTGFWVAVASGVALLLAVVVGGALYAALGMTRWQEHTSDRGGFRVELPGEPRDDLVRLVPKPVPGLVVEGTVLRLRREEYLVGYFEVPAERRKAGEQVLLRDGVTGMANAYPGSRVTQDDPIVVSDFPGREVVIEVPDKGTAVGRVVLAESRAYLVLAASPGATADNPRARRFLDSFAVTDPQLIAQGRARREAARLAAEAVEEQRRKAEEGFRKREEELRAQEQKRKEEAEARERAYQALLQKSRDEFRTPGRPAPDPYCVPGLVLHLGFEEDQPLWPAGAGKLDIAEGAVRGPGPRGSALYLPSIGRVTLRDLSPAVRHALGESATLAGWVKLRFRPLTLVEADGGRRVVGHLTVGGGRLVFNTRGGRDASADDRAPPGGTRVTAPWQRDDQWHHVAAVRERRRADERLALYLDGQPVGELTAGPADWSVAQLLRFGQGIDAAQGAWTGPTGPPDRNGQPAWPEPTETTHAVDEICLYDRALSPAEVRMLAGVEAVPADLARRQRPADPTEVKPAAVTLTPGGSLPRLAGIAFDPKRNTAWAVTDVGQADLLRLSYPDLKPVARYRLGGAAGPVAFDPEANRLFVVVRPPDPSGRPTHPPEPTVWPTQPGALHRYDLDDLPPPEAKPQRPLVPTASVRPRADRPAPFTALAVTADGQWVLAAAQSGPNSGLVYRIPSHFQNPDELQGAPNVGEPAGFSQRLAAAPTGSGVWYSLPVLGNWGSWSLLDAAAGGPKDKVTYLLGADFVVHDWAIHPDGDRLYVMNDRGGADEARPQQPRAAPTPMRRRPMVAPPPDTGGFRAAGYFGLTPDGRYLFYAAGRQNPGAAVLTAVDTTVVAEPGKLPPPAGVLKDGVPLAPFWVSPNGAVLVFRTGMVVRVGYPAGAAPSPPVPAARPARAAVAPMPRRAAPKPVAYAGTVPPAATELPALRFYLPFDEDAGPGVFEGVSKKVVGKLTDGRYVDGVRGKALRLSHDPGTKADPTRLDLADQRGALRVPADAPFTLSLWVRPVTPTGIRLTVFEARRQTARNRSVRLEVETRATPDGGSVGAWVGETGGGDVPNEHAWSGPSRPTGEWHHLAIVRDDQGRVRVLVDGAEARRWRGNGRFREELDFETVLMQLPSWTQARAADVDELCLFDATLTDDQIRQLAGLPPGEPVVRGKRFAPEPYSGKPVPAATDFPGLTFYLACDSFERAEVREAVSGKPVALPPGTRLVDGVRGRALRLTSAPDKDRPRGAFYGPDVPTTALKAAAGKPFTLSVWARLTEAGQDSASPVAAETPGPKANSIRRRVFVLSVGKTGASLTLTDEAAVGGRLVVSGPVTPAGQWVHLAVVRDEKNVVRLFVDGVCDPKAGQGEFRHALDYTRVRLAGGRPDGPPIDLDELAFFDRALTAAEIKTLAGK